jgi:hypothetical protein
MAHSQRLNAHEQKKERFEALLVFMLAGLVVAVVAALFFVVVPNSTRSVPDLQPPPPAPIHNFDSTKAQ